MERSLCLASRPPTVAPNIWGRYPRLGPGGFRPEPPRGRPHVGGYGGRSGRSDVRGKPPLATTAAGPPRRRRAGGHGRGRSKPREPPGRTPGPRRVKRGPPNGPDAERDALGAYETQRGRTPSHRSGENGGRWKGAPHVCERIKFRFDPHRGEGGRSGDAATNHLR